MPRQPRALALPKNSVSSPAKSAVPAPNPRSNPPLAMAMSRRNAMFAPWMKPGGTKLNGSRTTACERVCVVIGSSVGS